MANVTRIERSKGVTYRIRVGNGYDTDGNQKIKSTSWTPDPKLTDKQVYKELNKIVVEFEKNIANGLAFDNIKFADFSKKWLKDYAEKKCSPKYISEARRKLKVINKEIGHIPLPKIRKAHLQDFYTKLSSNIRLITKETLDANGKIVHSKIEKCMSPATVLTYHRLISTILTKATQWDYISNNICLGKGIELPKQRKYQPHYLQDTEVLTLVDLLGTAPIEYRTILLLLLCTGMRNGEAMGLEWRVIDFNNQLISISRSSQYLGRVGIFTKSTKNSSSTRVIRVVPEVIELLTKYKSWQSECRLGKGPLWKANPIDITAKHCDNWNTCKQNGKIVYCGIDNCKDRKDIDRLFTQYNGIPMHPDTALKWLKKFIKKNNLADFNVHSLRHTNVSLMIMQGVPLPSVARLVGHSSTATTTKIYSHSIQSAEQLAIEKVANVINPSRNVK